MEPLEQTTVPRAQEVGRSNRPAPTNRINEMRCDSSAGSSRLTARDFGRPASHPSEHATEGA
jgi:hypothetical protein